MEKANEKSKDKTKAGASARNAYHMHILSSTVDTGSQRSERRDEAGKDGTCKTNESGRDAGEKWAAY